MLLLVVAVSLQRPLKCCSCVACGMHDHCLLSLDFHCVYHMAGIEVDHGT
jgi:hypothetical protein